MEEQDFLVMAWSWFQSELSEKRIHHHEHEGLLQKYYQGLCCKHYQDLPPLEAMYFFFLNCSISILVMVMSDQQSS